MGTRKLLVASKSFPKRGEVIDNIMKAGIEVISIHQETTQEQFEIGLSEFADVTDLLLGSYNLSGDMVEQLPNLVNVIRYGKGVDNVDTLSLMNKGITLFTTKDSHAHSVAELTIGLVLSLIRHIGYNDVNKPIIGCALEDMKVGLLGFGTIGRIVTNLLRPFNCSVIAHDPNVCLEVFDEYDVSPATFEEVLTSANILSLHLPLTIATNNLINHENLRLMPKESFLINTSRAGVVDELALIQAIKSGQLAGAAIDTYSSKLIEQRKQLDVNLQSKLVLTPHIGSFTIGARERMQNECLQFILNSGVE
jgi:D-3-phosphoglycerate dehydrogenase